MTHRRSPMRPLAGLVIGVALLALSGCGRLTHRGPADVTARGPAAQATSTTHGKKHKHADDAAVPLVEKPRDPLEEARAQSVALPASPYWPYRVAELELARDSTAAAEHALADALTRDRDYAPALALLGKLDYRGGRNLDAISRLEAARQRAEAAGRPFPPELLAGLALQYDAIDRLDKAEPLAAALPDAGSPDERTARVFLNLRGTAPDSAAELAQQAAHDRPRSAADQNNYGITRLRAGDVDEARDAFLKAIKLDPSLAGPYYNLAILEKFYRFDDAAAGRWYADYRARSSDDPDGLARVFAAPAAGNANDPEAKP